MNPLLNNYEDIVLNQFSKVTFNPSNFGSGGPLTASTQPVSGMFNEQTNMEGDTFIDQTDASSFDNLTTTLFGDSGDSDNNIFVNQNKQRILKQNDMSLITSGSRLRKPVGTKPGITVVDLRKKSSDQTGYDISKSVPVFGSDVTSSEPSMGDWEIYLSKGRI